MSDVISIENKFEETHGLIFSLDDKHYAINIENVLEIIKVPSLDIPQKMPKHILGVITYNNISVNVVDLRTVLGLAPRTYNADSQVIIVKTEEAIFGLITDKVLDVKLLKSDRMQFLPYHSEENLIKFLYRFDNIFVSIVDLNSVQAVIQKTQFELNEFDVTSLFPHDKATKEIMQKRQLDLITKFETSIEQMYFGQEQFIIFELHENRYALSIKHVKEIVAYKNVTVVSLPKTYNYIEGIFNLRGDFISILNFNKFLKISDKNTSPNSMLIVLELKDFKIALLVDNIIDIVTINQNEVSGKFDNKFESKYVSGELNINNTPVSIISMDRLLADERLYIKD